MIGHINLSSIRNKFEMLSNSIKSNLCILMISETKLDSTLLSNKLTIEGYAARQRRRNNFIHKGGYPSQIANSFFTYKFRWMLLCCLYNPAKNNISSHHSIEGRSVNQCLRYNLGYKQKIIQFIRRNQVYFSSSNVSTDTTVIVKDQMLSEKFTFCFKITIKYRCTWNQCYQNTI